MSHAHLHTHVFAHVYARVHTHLYTHVYAHVHTHVYTHAHAHATEDPGREHRPRRQSLHRRRRLLYRLRIGIADGVSIARVWTCRHSK